MAAGVPVYAGYATRARSAALYAQSIVSFNGSLNGDLNMRVFEVLSRGFLLTDRLSPQAGLELLLRPGHDCETYGDAVELLDKIAFYRRSPLPRCGSPSRARRRIDGNIWPSIGSRCCATGCWTVDCRTGFNSRHDLRLAACSEAAAGQLDPRLAIYEIVQERQRPLAVVVRGGLAGWPLASVMDLADLMRTRVTVIEPAPALRAAAAAASVLNQLAFIDADAAARQDWDIVLTASADAANEPWRRRAGRVLFAEFADGKGGA